MPYEIKTIFQTLSVKIPMSFVDETLARLLNEGWQIVTLSHHAYSTIENNAHSEIRIRIITLRRETKAVPQAIPERLHNFVPGQRVRLIQDYPVEKYPLLAGDLGNVVAPYDDGEHGILFDRYDKISYSSAQLGSIFNYCEPYDEGSK